MKLSHRLTVVAASIMLGSIVVAGSVTEDQQMPQDQEPMYSLFVKMHVKPESIGPAKAALMKVAKGSVAEPDCFRYDVLTDRSDSTVFYLYEVFRNRDGHRKHTKTDHFQAFWAASEAHGGFLDGNMEIHRMTTLFPPTEGYLAQKSLLSEW